MLIKAPKFAVSAFVILFLMTGSVFAVTVQLDDSVGGGTVSCDSLDSLDVTKDNVSIVTSGTACVATGAFSGKGRVMSY